MTKLSRQNWTRIARNVAKAQSKIANDLLDVAEAEGTGEVAGPQEVVDAIEVIVYPLTPLNQMTAPNPPEVCVGDSVVIEVNPNFVNYWWNTGNPLDQGEDRVVVYPTQDFTYVVEALDSNGCESREEILVLVDTCVTSMHSEMFSKINIYPNPTSDKLYIDLPHNEIFTISVLSMEGKLILQEIEVLNSIVIASEKLTKGSYILRIENSND